MITKIILIPVILLFMYNLVVCITTLTTKEKMYTTHDRFKPRYVLVKKELITLVFTLMYIIMYIIFQ